MEKNKKIGTLFINLLENLFKNDGIILISLFCSPEKSQFFWRKNNYKKYPDFYNDIQLNMYKPIVKVLPPASTKQAEDITLKLWQCEPYQINPEKKVTKWSIKSKGGNTVLNHPIIIPAYKDWYIELSQKNDIIYKGKVKYFKQNISDDSDFLIIRNIDI